MNAPWIAALVAAVAGSLLTYLGAVRRLSGKIGTSEASQLWQESRDIREDYRAQIAAMRKVIDQCQERIDKLEDRNTQLHRENGRQGELLEEHERTIAELRKQVDRLGQDNDRLRGENRELQERVKELEAAA